MNELIATLAERAAQESAVLENEINLEVSVDDTTFQIPGNFIEKFAELLVKQCMELTERCLDGNDVFALNGAEILAERFGVEE